MGVGFIIVERLLSARLILGQGADRGEIDFRLDQRFLERLGD
jgi:hypothetical protein